MHVCLHVVVHVEVGTLGVDNGGSGRHDCGIEVPFTLSPMQCQWVILVARFHFAS